MCCFPSQLEVLRGESSSAKTLQGKVKALERDNADLQDQVQRLEKDLAARPDTINLTGKLNRTGSHQYPEQIF